MSSSHHDDPSFAARLKVEYDELAPAAERLRQELTRQIQALVDAHRIALGFPIESRVKSWDSVVSKLERLSLELDSVAKLQDLVGARLVVLFRRDADKLCSLIAETFNILKREDTALRLKEDRFGYSSIHFVTKLPEQWLSVPTLSSLGSLAAEIQVRTMAQHIWASSSHVLQYKNETSVPLPVRRSIHRVSALLETVDLELERVLADREKYSSEVNVSSQEPLNVDSLRKLLDSLLPPQNRGEDENYSVLLRELSEFGIKNTAELKNIVSKHLKSVLAEDKNLAQQRTEHQTSVDDSMRKRVDAGVFFIHVGLVRAAMSEEFGHKWDRHMIAVTIKYLPLEHPRRAALEKVLANIPES